MLPFSIPLNWEILIVFAVMVSVWSAICIFVFLRGKKVASFDTIYKKSGTYRRYFVLILVALIGAVLVATLFYLPFAPQRAESLGQPQVVVNAVGAQWSWTLSNTTVPSNVPVEFNVTSQDVNHDFGIFNPQGNLVGQVQVIPGYANQLIIVFTQPGTYTIRCLEYCGPGHPFMVTHLTVS